MNKIEKLTPQQEKQLEIIKNKWLDKVFNYELNKKGSFENAVNQMKDLYKFCNLNEPIVLYLESPMACQIAANILENKGAQVWDQVESQVGSQVWSQVRAQVRDQVESQVGSQVLSQVWDQVGSQVGSQVKSQVWSQVRAQVLAQVGSQVWSQVRDQVGDQVRSQVRSQVGSQVRDQARSQVRAHVGSQVGSQVWSQVRDQVGDQVRSQVRSQVGSQVRDQVWSQVRDQVGDQVRDQVLSQVWDQVGDQVRDHKKISYYTFSSYINYSDFGILSFFDFMDNVLHLNLNKDLKRWNKWSESAFMSIQFEGLCIVSNFPNYISRNETNNLHSIDGYAITFNDGYGLNFINGKHLPDDIFNQIKNNTYSLESFLKQTNEEIKSAAIEMMQLIYGDAVLVRFFGDNLKEVDSYIDKKEEKYLKGTTRGMNIGVYTLYKGKINGNNIAYVQVFCPSTDRMFFLGVEPHHTKAKDAIASLYRVPSIVKDHIKNISRQGERFFTSFTEEGYKKLESLKGITEYSTITGSEYFSKMQYEF